MRTLYLANGKEFEAEGMFDKDGTLLGFWSCNDASWRNEYFLPFMHALGFNIESAPDWMCEKLDIECGKIVLDTLV